MRVPACARSALCPVAGNALRDRPNAGRHEARRGGRGEVSPLVFVGVCCQRGMPRRVEPAGVKPRDGVAGVADGQEQHLDVVPDPMTLFVPHWIDELYFVLKTKTVRTATCAARRTQIIEPCLYQPKSCQAPLGAHELEHGAQGASSATLAGVHSRRGIRARSRRSCELDRGLMMPPGLGSQEARKSPKIIC